MPKISGKRILAANILARGFVDDPMWKFILPKSQSRLQILTAMFEVFVDDGIKRGKVLLAPDRQGAIIWYPSQVNVFDDTFADVEAKINEIAYSFKEFDAIQRLETIGKKVQPLAPTIPHHEIFWISTLPAFRGKGVGSSLLKPILNNADTQNVGCYLVSSNPNNIGFYEHHGFKQVSLIPLKPEPTLVAMWRNFNDRDSTAV